MEKYLTNGSITRKTRIDALDGGLLSLLTQVKENNESNIPVSAGWEERGSQILSTVDIACDRSRQDAAARNFVGWKTLSDGKKVYTTFRNGHKVAAHGHEGFKLATGDSLKNRNNKEKSSKSVPATSDITVKNCADARDGDSKPRKRKSEEVYTDEFSKSKKQHHFIPNQVQEGGTTNSAIQDFYTF